MNLLVFLFLPEGFLFIWRVVWGVVGERRYNKGPFLRGRALMLGKKKLSSRCAAAASALQGMLAPSPALAMSAVHAATPPCRGAAEAGLFYDSKR